MSFYIQHKDNSEAVWSMGTEGKDSTDTTGGWVKPTDVFSLFKSRQYAQEYLPKDGVIREFTPKILEQLRRHSR